MLVEIRAVALLFFLAMGGFYFGLWEMPLIWRFVIGIIILGIGFMRRKFRGANHLRYSVFFLSFGAGVVLSNWTVPPAFAVCYMLGVMACLFGYLAFRFPQHYFGWFALGVCVLWALPQTYKHQFAGMESYYEAKQVLPRDASGLTNSPPSGLLDNKQVLKNWLRHQAKLEPHIKKPKLAVVAASGGGIRAASWTVSVLTQLDETITNFSSHVRLVTGASGGMLGGAYYVARLKDVSLGAHGSGSAQLTNRVDIVRKISRDSLSAAVSRLALSDIPMAWWPGSYLDRGGAIEEAWETNTDGLLAMELSYLKGDELKGRLPSLVFSPMLVEDGRRLLISNLSLSNLTENTGNLLSINGVEMAGLYSASSVEFFRLFPNATGFKLSTAARMSASFPYVSPAGVLPTAPPRRVVDAGYYDNYGVSMATLWIYQNRTWLMNHVSGVVLIQIRDSMVDEKRTQLSDPSDQAHLWRPGLPWLTTPLEGIMNAREAAMSFRNDERVAILSELLNRNATNFFTTVDFEFSDDAPLSWSLTTDQINRLTENMRESGTNNWKRLQQLSKWWNSPGS